MNMARLEHANITVADANKTAAWLGRVFGWEIRWQGSAMNGEGHTMHVGGQDDYLALYQPKESKPGQASDYFTSGQLNHVGIVVENLALAESAVLSEGYEPHSHQNYEPGARFYFYDENKIEFEVVAYD
jgi:catechol 2,3-dioxygenase-like lactoylglutathione lyase family enzyme